MVNRNFKQVVNNVNKFQEISLLKKEFKKPVERSEDWLLSFSALCAQVGRQVWIK